MIKEIKNKYQRFHDGIILDIIYSVTELGEKSGSKREASLYIQTHDYQTGNSEKIKLIFLDITKFKFFESEKICSTIIFEAFIEERDNLIIFDFDCLQLDGRDKLAENRNSNFVIHCKGINYEIMDSQKTFDSRAKPLLP